MDHVSQSPTAETDRVADREILAEELAAVLGNLRRQTRRNIGRPWPSESLSAAQLELLRLIRRQPGISVTEAAAELGLAGNSVSTLVRQLAAQALIVRTTDGSDKRVARLNLSEAARQRADAWLDRRSGLFAAVLDELGPAELIALSDAVPILRRIADAFAGDVEMRPDGSCRTTGSPDPRHRSMKESEILP